MPIDDTHFLYAGMEQDDLKGVFLTEENGASVKLLPIQKKLRYLIPFKTVEEVIDELKRQAEKNPGGLAVYADDGEKFGVWPKTHQHCYKDGWLEEFFTALSDNSDWLDVITLGQAAMTRPVGRVYLPTASYAEMLHWSLPPKAFVEYEEFEEWLKDTGKFEKYGRYVRGGHWRSFLAKYDEANMMHKRMLMVSNKFDQFVEQNPKRYDVIDQARHHLYAAQCNCPYWHGLFGGLYLPHLRDAIYRNLIAAEDEIDRLQQGEEDWISFEEEDFDGDRADEILVENRWLNVYVDPSRGGCLTEIDHRPTRFCLSNTLTRRIEGYHREILEASGEQHQPAGDQDEAPPASIHDRVRLIDPGLGERLVADNCWRRSFLDRFPAPDTTLEQLYQGTYREEGDFLDAPYHLEQASIDEDGDCDFIMLMTRAGCIERDGRRWQLLLEKRLVVAADRADLRVEYRLRNTSNEPLSLCFAPELNLTLLAGDSPDRLYEFAGLIGPGPRMRSMGELDQATWFALVDHSQHLRVRLEFDPPATVWRHPVETVSQSETGFELLYQGSAILPCWRLQLVANQTHVVSVRLQLQTISADSVVPLEPPAAG